MLLQEKKTGNLIEVDDLVALINPQKTAILGQDQVGEEEQDPEEFEKENLVFPSGENLPRCWSDANYKRV